MISLVQIVLLSTVSLIAARPYVDPSYGNRAYETAYEAKPEPYSFAYETKDEYGTLLNRKEEGDELGNKRGSYGYVDTYGIYRQVDYVADEKGFRAVISTNEPGTKNENPADVEILSEAVQVNYDALGKAPVAAAYSKPALAVAAPVSSLVPAYGRPNPSAYAPGPAVYTSAPGVYDAPQPAYASSVPEAYSPVQVAYGPVSEAYSPVQAAYGPAPEVYSPVQPTYGLAPEAYSPVQANYGPVEAYPSSAVYEPLSPQTYGGPSYEQLSDRAGEPTESHTSYE